MAYSFSHYKSYLGDLSTCPSDMASTISAGKPELEKRTSAEPEISEGDSSVESSSEMSQSYRDRKAERMNQLVVDEALRQEVLAKTTFYQEVTLEQKAVVEEALPQEVTLEQKQLLQKVYEQTATYLSTTKDELVRLDIIGRKISRENRQIMCDAATSLIGVLRYCENLNLVKVHETGNGTHRSIYSAKRVARDAPIEQVDWTDFSWDPEEEKRLALERRARALVEKDEKDRRVSAEKEKKARRTADKQETARRLAEKGEKEGTARRLAEIEEKAVASVTKSEISSQTKTNSDQVFDGNTESDQSSVSTAEQIREMIAKRYDGQAAVKPINLFDRVWAYNANEAPADHDGWGNANAAHGLPEDATWTPDTLGTKPGLPEDATWTPDTLGTKPGWPTDATWTPDALDKRTLGALTPGDWTPGALDKKPGCDAPIDALFRRPVDEKWNAEEEFLNAFETLFPEEHYGGKDGFDGKGDYGKDGFAKDGKGDYGINGFPKDGKGDHGKSDRFVWGLWQVPEQGKADRFGKDGKAESGKGDYLGKDGKADSGKAVRFGKGALDSGKGDRFEKDGVDSGKGDRFGKDGADSGKGDRFADIFVRDADGKDRFGKDAPTDWFGKGTNRDWFNFGKDAKGDWCGKNLKGDCFGKEKADWFEDVKGEWCGKAGKGENFGKGDGFKGKGEIMRLGYACLDAKGEGKGEKGDAWRWKDVEWPPKTREDRDKIMAVFEDYVDSMAYYSSNVEEPGMRGQPSNTGRESPRQILLERQMRESRHMLPFSETAPEPREEILRGLYEPRIFTRERCQESWVASYGSGSSGGLAALWNQRFSRGEWVRSDDVCPALRLGPRIDEQVASSRWPMSLDSARKGEMNRSGGKSAWIDSCGVSGKSAWDLPSKGWGTYVGKGWGAQPGKGWDNDLEHTTGPDLLRGPVPSVFGIKGASGLYPESWPSNGETLLKGGPPVLASEE